MTVMIMIKIFSGLVCRCRRDGFGLDTLQTESVFDPKVTQRKG